MGETTKIEWADATFNPWIGCQHVSPACDHCYAEAYAKRTGQGGLWGDGERRRTKPATWAQPLNWDRKARAEGRRIRVFCASLADVFDNAVPADWRRDLVKLMGMTTNIDWMLLTKRIGNARAMLDEAVADIACGINDWTDLPWPNVWIGATVVNQQEADRDIPKLLATPARVRFLSIEPMLGPIDLTRIHIPNCQPRNVLRSEGCAIHANGHCLGDCEGRLRALNWVICGGESGPHARPMHPAWVHGLRDQCEAAGVPFLFKQWGEWLPGGQPEASMYNGDGASIHDWDDTDDGFSIHVGKKAAGRQLDGRTWDGFPAALL